MVEAQWSTLKSLITVTLLAGFFNLNHQNKQNRVTLTERCSLKAFAEQRHHEPGSQLTALHLIILMTLERR